MATLPSPSPAPPALDFLPASWRSTVGLLAGFGDRLAGPPAGTLLVRTQVHGSRVIDAALLRGGAEPDPCDGLARLPVEADALVAREPGVVVGVRTADCVPLLLVAPRRRWAAAVHAGWRGTIAGIATEAVAAARRDGVEAGELEAALGPSIGPCCYEVSDEVASPFREASLPVAGPLPGRSRPHLDLRAVNRVLLERAGVDPARIHEAGPCTRCASGRFHSYRADPGASGRQVSWIGWEDRRR